MRRSTSLPDASKNLSDAVLVHEIDRASGRIRSAAVVRSAVQKASVTLGLAIAAALPLLSPSGDPQTTQTKEIMDTKKEGEGTTDSQLPMNFDMRRYIIEGDKSAKAGPIDIKITGVPPLGRDWHRTVLEEGDEFWALPDASFLIKAKTVQPCGPGDTNCTATLDFISDGLLIANFAIKDRRIERSPDTENSSLVDTLVCETAYRDGGENLLTPTLRCRFDRVAVLQNSQTSLPAAPDMVNLCFALRRSESLEQAHTPAIALDVKWERTNPDNPRSELCPKN